MGLHSTGQNLFMHKLALILLLLLYRYLKISLKLYGTSPHNTIEMMLFKK
jgi:hypothetical protein